MTERSWLRFLLPQNFFHENLPMENYFGVSKLGSRNKNDGILCKISALAALPGSKTGLTVCGQKN